MLVHKSDRSAWQSFRVHKGKPLPPGTLRAVLKGARVSVDELREKL